MTNLDLRYNGISGDGAKAIAEALKVNPVLNNFPKASGTLRRTPLWLRTHANFSDCRKRAISGFAKPLPSTSAHTTVSRALRSSGQHNGDTGDVLRAAAKPGLAIEL